jgi:hypothetical protein
MTNLIHEGDHRRKKEMNLRNISFSLNQRVYFNCNQRVQLVSFFNL